MVKALLLNRGPSTYFTPELSRMDRQAWTESGVEKAAGSCWQLAKASHWRSQPPAPYIGLY